MGDTKFGALVLILVLGFLVAVGPAALADGATPTAVEDESLTVDYDTESNVSESGLEYGSNVTVQNSTGATLQDGTDYEWDATAGNVTWINTSATSEGELATIDYEVEQVSNESKQLADIVGILTLPLALLILLVLGLTTVKVVNG